MTVMLTEILCMMHLSNHYASIIMTLDSRKVSLREDASKRGSCCARKTPKPARIHVHIGTKSVACNMIQTNLLDD